MSLGTLFKAAIPCGVSAVSLKITIWPTRSLPRNFPAVYAESTRYSATVTSVGECLQPSNEASAIREKRVRTMAFISVIVQRGGAHRQPLISRKLSHYLKAGELRRSRAIHARRAIARM